MSQPIDWSSALQQAKEKLAKAVFAVGGVSDGEKELLLKDILWEIEQLQKYFQDISGHLENNERVFQEENELLRSLLGTGDHELRARVIGLAQEMHELKKESLLSKDELESVRKKAETYARHNEDLRHTLKKAELRLQEMEQHHESDWQKQMSGFADQQGRLQRELGLLEREIVDVQKLMSVQTEQLTREKQRELADQQIRLMRQMREALEQKEELLWAEEALFARGVAQKLRGELQSASGRLQLTLEKFNLLETGEHVPADTVKSWWRLLRKGGPDELRKGFTQAYGFLQNVVRTLEEYLTLTHHKQPDRLPLHIPSMIQKLTAELYTERLDKGALEILVPEVLPLVMGDSGLLEWVLKALVDNAFEALPTEGGVVRIQVEKSPDKKQVFIDISDTGKGIPVGLQPRLFQPFFTTKDDHKGLGLARARRYVEWHRGRLEMLETSPTGTKFRLRLPLEDGGEGDSGQE